MLGAIITQRRIGLRFRFDAREEVLKYSVRDYSGESTIEIPYESMNLSQPAYVTLAATPLFRRLFGLVLLLLLMAAAISAFDPDTGIICALVTAPLSLWILVGKLTGWTDIRFKLFDLRPLPPGAQGPMRIIDDEKGEEILTIVKDAQKAKLKRLHGKANPLGDPNQEIARLTWLKDIDVLSQEEWQIEVAKVRTSDEDGSSSGQVSGGDEITGSVH